MLTEPIQQNPFHVPIKVQMLRQVRYLNGIQKLRTRVHLRPILNQHHISLLFLLGRGLLHLIPIEGALQDLLYLGSYHFAHAHLGQKVPFVLR